LSVLLSAPLLVAPDPIHESGDVRSERVVNQHGHWYARIFFDEVQVLHVLGPYFGTIAHVVTSLSVLRASAAWVDRLFACIHAAVALSICWRMLMPVAARMATSSQRNSGGTMRA